MREKKETWNKIFTMKINSVHFKEMQLQLVQLQSRVSNDRSEFIHEFSQTQHSHQSSTSNCCSRWSLSWSSPSLLSVISTLLLVVTATVFLFVTNLSLDTVALISFHCHICLPAPPTPRLHIQILTIAVQARSLKHNSSTTHKTYIAESLTKNKPNTGLPVNPS